MPEIVSAQRLRERKCKEYRDDGYEDCKEYRDDGYNACDRWAGC